MLMVLQTRAATRTLRGWAISVLLGAGAVWLRVARLRVPLNFPYQA
jgi:hypothetical protein